MSHEMDEKLNLNNNYSFKLNSGQNNKNVKYMVTKDKYMMMFLEDEIIMGLKEAMNNEDPKALNKNEEYLKGMKTTESSDFFKILFKDSLSDMEIIGEEKGEGNENCFEVNLPRKGINNVPMYSKIRYKGIYHGIDLVFYFNNGNLEYCFTLQPGTNPRTINMIFEGIDSLKLDGDKNIEVIVKECKISIRKLRAYQTYNEINIEVSSEFKINDNRLSLEIGHYDKTLPLVIESVPSYSPCIHELSDDKDYSTAKDDEENYYEENYDEENYYEENYYEVDVVNPNNFTQTLPITEEQYNNVQSIDLDNNNPNVTHKEKREKAERAFTNRFNPDDTTFSSNIPKRNCHPKSDIEDIYDLPTNQEREEAERIFTNRFNPDDTTFSSNTPERNCHPKSDIEDIYDPPTNQEREEAKRVFTNRFNPDDTTFSSNVSERNRQRKPDIEDIYDLLTNPDYGLAKINREVRGIEKILKAIIIGLGASNREIQFKLELILESLNCRRRFNLTTGSVRRECKAANLIINICNKFRRAVELEIRRKNLCNDRRPVSTTKIVVEACSSKEIIFRNIPELYEVEIRGVTTDIKVKVTEVECENNCNCRPIRLCRISEPRRI
jgi:hypothetical protein